MGDALFHPTLIKAQLYDINTSSSEAICFLKSLITIPDFIICLRRCPLKHISSLLSCLFIVCSLLQVNYKRLGLSHIITLFLSITEVIAFVTFKNNIIFERQLETRMNFNFLYSLRDGRKNIDGM